MRPEFLALLPLLFAAPSLAVPRNVRLATYNVQQMPDDYNHDGHYFAADGTPLTDAARLDRQIAHILASDYEVVALNEVFNEGARATLVNALRTDFPFFVAYIGNDTDLQDSGLMLFSRHPFVEMQLDPEHTYECGDVEIGFDGQDLDCPDKLLAFTEYHCDIAYAAQPVWDQPDCYSSKGAGLVQVLLPSGEAVFVGFTHMVATYDYDGDGVRRAKIRDRQEGLEAIGQMVQDATEENAPLADPGDFTDDYVVLMGDLNIDGNPFHAQEIAEQDAEWGQAFDGAQAEVAFTSCGGLDETACRDGGHALVDPWAFDMSVEDLGRTNGLPFTLDVTDTSQNDQGERLDYVLYRGPSLDQAGSLDRMVAQHPHIGWSLAGEQGELSDHLPVAIDLLLPIREVAPPHSTPRTARVVTMATPTSPNPPNTALTISQPGHMQWLRLDVPPGSYTVRTSSTVGFDLYAPEDLTRPLPIRREAIRNGFVYLLDSPPYFVRTFAQATVDGERVHNREVTLPYTVQVTRHRCTSPDQACILQAAGVSEPVTWPATAVNPTDTLFFEFIADDSDQPTAPFHDFVVKRVSGGSLPAFATNILTLNQVVVPNVVWSTPVATSQQRTRKARGVTGLGGTFRSLLFTLRRTSLAYTGQVTVAHTTNLTYFAPMSLRVVQENDDSAHDELVLFTDPTPGNLFYQNVSDANIHQHANLYAHLPQIDELEDGGTAWPAGTTIGHWRLTEEFPIVLAENDDEDNDVEPGDWLLAQPAAGNAFAVANGHAVGTLPLDVPHADAHWDFTNDASQADPDDTDYWYTLGMRLSHTPPCLVWSNIACP